MRVFPHLNSLLKDKRITVHRSRLPNAISTISLSLRATISYVSCLLMTAMMETLLSLNAPVRTWYSAEMPMSVVPYVRLHIAAAPFGKSSRIVTFRLFF